MAVGLFLEGNKALRNYKGGILLSPYASRGQESDVAPRGPGGWIVLVLVKRLKILFAVKKNQKTKKTSAIVTAFQAFILHINDAFSMTWAGLALSDECPWVPHVKASLQNPDKTDAYSWKQPNSNHIMNTLADPGD